MSEYTLERLANNGMNIPPDTMSPKQRMMAFSRGDTIDRLPCQPSLGQNSALYFGYTSAQFNQSADVIVEVWHKIFEIFRPDGVNINPSLQAIPEAMGAKLSFRDVGAPVFIEQGIRDHKQLDDMVAADPYRDGRLPLYLEALQRLGHTIGDEACLSSSVGGPFTAAALLQGTEHFLKDLIKQPELAHKVLALTTQSVLNYIDAVCDLGFSPSLAEPLASCTVISRKQFNEFAKPYLQVITHHLKEKYGRDTSIHICGNSKPVWQDIIDAGFTAFSLDNIEDLAVAREAVGGQLTLIGNVKPVDTLLNGSVKDVFTETELCIRKAYQNPKGFILGSGCEIPANAPMENILAMMNAARVYGQMSITF